MFFIKKIYFQLRSDAFTLIEMLLVVAIISLLATMAVTAFSAARNRALNSRIQAELSQVRSQAISIKNDTDSFADLCDASNTLNNAGYSNSLGLLESDITTRSGYAVGCYATDDAYCVQARMLPSGTYCIDLAGYAGTLKTCNITNFDCE